MKRFIIATVAGTLLLVSGLSTTTDAGWRARAYRNYYPAVGYGYYRPAYRPYYRPYYGAYYRPYARYYRPYYGYGGYYAPTYAYGYPYGGGVSIWW